MAPCYDAITFNELSLQFIHHLRQEVQQPVATFASVIIYLDWTNYQNQVLLYLPPLKLSTGFAFVPTKD